jgi:PTS system nitrogen regulatory IIA component
MKCSFARSADVDEILTVKEMAQFLKMNERTVLKMAQTGAIPAAKIGGQWRFKRELVDRWLDDKMVGGATRFPRGADSATGVVMPLAAMLDERLVTLDLEGSTKTEVLSQLAQLLVDSRYLQRADSFLQRLLERENLMTTALGDGVAFPHPREPQGDLFDRPKLVVGISPQGIEYGALDAKLVHVLFLICAPDDSTHLWIMAQLTRLFRGTNTVEQLVKAQSRGEVITLLTQWDRSL